MGDRFENTAEIVIPALDDYIRTVTKTGGTRRALASELAKKIVEEYEGSTLGGEERTIQAAIADAKQVASEAIQEEQTAREEADTAITADLAKKAYADGEYADLHAGTANQILSDTYTTDEEPYHYRQIPSHAGTRAFDEIVGGSVCWNQLVNTSTSSVTVTSGHKYVAKISDAWSVGTSAGTALSVTGGTDMVFDITQMFPSTIADHIYNLEQATAGAGIAFFKKYFGDDYHPYDAGTMRSVEGLVSHDMVGFNQWDEEFVENKRIAQTTGQQQSGVTTDSFCSKNYTRCLPETTLYVYSPISVNIYWYDADKNYINYATNRQNITTRVPSNAIFFKIDSRNNSDGIYHYNICINLSNTAKNGIYEPYTKHSYQLDNTVTLRGIPQLVDGKLKWDGDIYPPSGLISRRYGIVDLGALDWIYRPSGYNVAPFYAHLENAKIPSSSNIIIHAVISNGYEQKAPNSINISGVDKVFAIGQYFAANMELNIVDSAYTSAAAFKTAMSGKYLVYELATPTTEQAEPYQSLQTCSPYGTEEYVSTGIVPVGHYTQYPTDLKGIVEKVADVPSSDGTYTLKATVSNGVVTYSWESA